MNCPKRLIYVWLLIATAAFSYDAGQDVATQKLTTKPALYSQLPQ